MPRPRSLLLPAAVALLSAGYGGDASITAPELEVLDEAPIVLTIDGVAYFLDASVWRDFGLTEVPLDERGLIASFRIRRVDGAGIPRACDTHEGCT